MEPLTSEKLEFDFINEAYIQIWNNEEHYSAYGDVKEVLYSQIILLNRSWWLN